MRALIRPGLVLAITVALFALPTMAFGALSRAASPASNTATFQDSTGEDPQAPDITSVTVSNDDTGMLTFRVNIANRPTLSRDMDFEVYVDTDNNASTGDQQLVPGADYLVQLFDGDAILWKWDGSNFSRSFGNPPSVTLSTTYANGPVIRISAAELGNTKAFKFMVFAVSGITFDPVTNAPDFTNAAVDSAPNYGSGLYPFSVKVTPPTLVAKKLTAVPARPAAGKPFTLRLVAARSDTGAVIQNGKVACVARVGSARLRATVAKVVAGAATCTWKIPATAKGKSFRGSVAVTFEGLTASQAYVGKVR